MAALLIPLLLAIAIFGHGKPLPCDGSACSDADKAAEQTLTVTTDPRLQGAK